MKKSKYDINSKLVSLRNSRSSVAEAFRSIRLNIQFAARGQEIKTILVTSANPSEGKSLTASNLAVVMAQSNARTLYVDTDMRRPTGHATFRLLNDKGLSSYLSGQHALEEVLQDHCIIPHLHVVTVGPLPPNPLELLGEEKMARFLEQVRMQYDVVIIDSPPLIVSDPMLLAAQVDGTVLVVDTKKTKQADAFRAAEQLRTANGNILGVVMNNVREKEIEYYY